MNVAIEARKFAIAAHEATGQKRKYTGEPYWHHPLEVSQIVKEIHPENQFMIAAAWLHDVVEDTEISIETIQAEFGPRVAKMVEEVTDVSKPENGNRAVRKAIDREHLAGASYEGKTIKLADMIANTSSILEHDPEFAKVYMAEKRALLEVLKDGHPNLFKWAQSIVDKYYESEK